MALRCHGCWGSWSSGLHLQSSIWPSGSGSDKTTSNTFPATSLLCDAGAGTFPEPQCLLMYDDANTLLNGRVFFL